MMKPKDEKMWSLTDHPAQRQGWTSGPIDKYQWRYSRLEANLLCEPWLKWLPIAGGQNQWFYRSRDRLQRSSR